MDDPSRIDFIIIEKNSKEKIGFCGIADMNNNSSEIGYTIGDKSAQGKGYASEAVSTLINEFSNKGITMFYSTVHKDNISSIKVVEKNQFTLEHKIDDVFLLYKKELSN